MAFDLKAALINFAPTIAGMLGGPFAGMAVKSLESAFGLDAGAGVDRFVEPVTRDRRQ